MSVHTILRLSVVAALVLSGAACKAEHKSAAPRQSTTSAPAGGKPQPPVEVAAKISGASATVTLAFNADATGVDVEVRGVDGLAVTSAAQPIAQATYAAGSTETLAVTLAPPAGPSNLVVTVRGTFGGVTGTKVASFTVGDAGAAPRKTGNAVRGPSGERIEELPAQLR